MMTSEDESKSVNVMAGPVPEELYSFANELNSISASNGKIHRESVPELLLPPTITNLDGAKQYLSDFLPQYGLPSPFHPVCCAVKFIV